MAVRVRLRIKAKDSGSTVETNALVNSGFETLRPQLLVPRRLAEKLGLWPGALEKARYSTYMTAGGPVKNYVMPDAVSVSLVEEDLEPQNVDSDLVVSEVEEEVLISDKLTSRLCIIFEDAGEGVYSLKADPSRRQRRTRQPEYW
jgi:predicted aspartyl protease